MGGFRHIGFDDNCEPLVATVATDDGYNGGFAFSSHPGLSRVALYPNQRIDEYRDGDCPSRLVSVLIHEEAHLAASLAAGGWRGSGALAQALWENNAKVAQYAACLYVSSDREPSRREFNLFLNELDRSLSRFLRLLPATADVPAIVAAASRLAVAAARGEEALPAASSIVIQRRRPLAALKTAFFG